ncbi:MAG: PQQ-binding-like beta-propeller repeat protein [Planctomycetota bacterium]|nr:PQQ-binding-like beta-propeller repeat protein [Planctomycetota bacterium]
MNQTIPSVFLFVFIGMAVPAFSQDSQGNLSENGKETWSQWRGSGRNSLVKGNWPSELTESNLKKLWSKPFDSSYSGPIVLGDMVITTETKDKKSEVVTAVNKVSGEKVWSTEWKGSMSVPFFAAKNGSWIRSTPATDGKRVYIAGIKGLFVCLDSNTGKVLWEVDLNKRYGVSPESFGHVCSPLLIPDDMEQAVYIQCSAGFLKMNRLTGKEIWRTPLGTGSMMSGGAFSSPIVATLSGQRQLVIQSRSELAGIDIATGKTLWKQPVPSFRGMNILTPSIQDNTIFTSSYNNKSFAYEISKSSQSLSVQSKWQSNLRAYMSSPVIIDGHAYVHLQNRQLACFEISSGETKWVSKSRKRFGEYWSMIGCKNQILALDSGGTLYLLKANPDQYEMLGQVKLETSNSWAHLAVEGNRIYVRGLKSLIAYEWK